MIANKQFQVTDRVKFRHIPDLRPELWDTMATVKRVIFNRDGVAYLLGLRNDFDCVEGLVTPECVDLIESATKEGDNMSQTDKLTITVMPQSDGLYHVFVEENPSLPTECGCDIGYDNPNTALGHFMFQLSCMPQNPFEAGVKLDLRLDGGLPDPSLWPRECQQKALAQGWDIFDADGSADGRWQLQAVAAPWDTPELGYDEPKFRDKNGHVSDRAAAKFVQNMADAGDDLAQRAIKFLIIVKSKDIEKFGLHLPETP